MFAPRAALLLLLVGRWSENTGIEGDKGAAESLKYFDTTRLKVEGR
jgi:hypothetical protein